MRGIVCCCRILRVYLCVGTSECVYRVAWSYEGCTGYLGKDRLNECMSRLCMACIYYILYLQNRFIVYILW